MSEATKECGFCYPREQGTHGEIKREWSQEWNMHIPVCRKHALYDGMDPENKMNTHIYIDKLTPFLTLATEKLSDGSEVANLHFRGGEIVPCVNHKAGIRALELVAEALEAASGEKPLIL